MTLLDQDHKGSMILQDNYLNNGVLFPSDIVNVFDPKEAAEHSSLLISEAGEDDVI